MDKKSVFLTLLVAAGVIAAPFFGGITLLLAVALLAALPVSRFGIFSRLAIAVVAYGIVGAALMQLTTITGLRFSFTAFHAVMLLAAAALAYINKDRLEIRTTANDLMGLAVGLTVFLVIALPLFGASMSKTMEYLLPGEDNHSHFQMYRYVLLEKQYAYANDPGQAGIRPTLLSYAQGSHAALAVVTSPAAENADRAGQLKVFAFGVAAAFSLLFWFAFLLVTRPLAAIKDRWLRLGIGFAVAAPFIVAVPLGTLLALYAYGYYPQYASYLCLTLLLLVVGVLLETKPKPSRLVVAEELAICVLLYGVFSSWYLLTPLAALPVLAYLFIRRSELMAEKWRVLAVAAPFLLLITHLAYVFLFTSSGASHVLTTGGVEKMRMWLLWICLPLVATVIIHIRGRQWFRLAFAGSLLGAAGLAALIGLYQLKKLGHYDYYFYKMLFSVLYLAVLYYGYLASVWLAGVFGAVKVPERLSVQMLPVLLGVVLLGFMLMTFNLPKYLDKYMTRTYSIPQTAADRPLDIFTRPQVYERYDDLVMLSFCNPYTNFTGTIWAGTYYLPYSPARQQLENSLQTRTPQQLAEPESGLLKDITAYASSKKKPVALVVSDACSDPVAVARLMAGKNIRVILPDGSAVR